MSVCVCGSSLEFDDCCGPILAGRPAPTAETLMRSRYAAHALGQLDHIERTLAPAALASFDRTETQGTLDETQWLKLEVFQTQGGRPEDSVGQVEFIFHYRLRGQKLAQHELAHFVRRDGVWLYSHSEIDPKGPPLRRDDRIGRNDPCPCGSGKKYKKCCGK